MATSNAPIGVPMQMAPNKSGVKLWWFRATTPMQSFCVHPNFFRFPAHRIERLWSSPVVNISPVSALIWLDQEKNKSNYLQRNHLFLYFHSLFTCATNFGFDFKLSNKNFPQFSCLSTTMSLLGPDQTFLISSKYVSIIISNCFLFHSYSLTDSLFSLRLRFHCHAQLRFRHYVRLAQFVKCACV